MISLDQLKLRFPVENVPPYGECVVVPGADFDPDWEAFLDEEGYACIFTDIDDEKVTLVPTINRHRGKSEKTVHESRTEKEEPPTPQPIRKYSPAMKGPAWSREDEDRLIKRITELKGSLEGKCTVLTKEFQGRSPNALLQRFKKLVKAGRGLPGKRGGPKKVVDIEGLDKSLENVCPDCGLPKDLCCCDEEKKESLREEPRARVEKQPIGSGPEHIQSDPVEKLLQEILALLQPEDESVTFDWYCRKCRINGTVQDDEVWRLCPRCGEPLIIWNVK